MKFIRKNLSNILFVLFALFLFSPYGLPLRAFLIKGVSMVTTRLFDLEIDQSERETLKSYEWRLEGRDGAPVDFGETRGKVVLVNFWATWCPPCVAEMPSMQELYEAYGDRVEFLFVARDEREKVEGFLSRKGYTFPVYFERSNPPAEMRSNSLPTTYLIDRSGSIRVEKVGAADWNSGRVRELLDTLIKEKSP